MEELVTLLKQAREDKGISLEEISRQTKIQLRYLEALESGDFTPFAGEVYLKGALTNYAAIVGLDGGEVLALYRRLKNEIAAPEEPDQSATPDKRPPEPARAVKPVKKKAPRKRDRQGPSLTAGVVVLVLALIGAGIWFSRNYEWPDLNAEPEQTENNAVDENGAGDSEEPTPEQLPRQEVGVASATTGETVFTIIGFEAIEIVLTFQGPCWVQLAVDGTEQFYPRTFVAGEDYTATAGESIRLRMGNPQAVNITVNGFKIDENREMTNPHNFLFNLE